MNFEKNRLAAVLPQWLLRYRAGDLLGDLTAGLVVTVMLIPQSLAYAMLAGLPLEVGLYSSILPLMAYALFGTSMTLAVGPVAVASLMTASALAPLALAGTPLYTTLAVQLALLTGLMLLLFGLLRFGFLAHLLSHSVISGFVTGSALLIAVGQIKGILGVAIDDGNVPETLVRLWQALGRTDRNTLLIGVGTLLFLLFARTGLPALLQRVGLPRSQAALCARLAPMLAVVLSSLAVWRLDWLASGVRVVGQVPAGLPALAFDWPGWETSRQLLLPALLIGVVAFVETVSVAQSLAMKRQQRIQPDRELLGLGAANVASAVSGGYVVVGGFARSVVNFDAGANTPLASVISAMLMALVLMGLTSSFAYLPHAVLSATIIVAVLGLVDLRAIAETWRYDKIDALALIATLLGVVLWSVELGILLGVAYSVGGYMWNASRPHVAVVGRMPGGEQHFRNVERYQVETSPRLILLRIDESLFFGNAQVIEEIIYARVLAQPQARHVVLILSAVNHIDATALARLVEVNRYLASVGKQLHLAEIKGPVMDRLRHTRLLETLSGRCFLSTASAYQALTAADA